LQEGKSVSRWPSYLLRFFPSLPAIL